MANKRDLLRQTSVLQRRVGLTELVDSMIEPAAQQAAGLMVAADGNIRLGSFVLTSVGLTLEDTPTAE